MRVKLSTSLIVGLAVIGEMILCYACYGVYMYLFSEFRRQLCSVHFPYILTVLVVVVVFSSPFRRFFISHTVPVNLHHQFV